MEKSMEAGMGRLVSCVTIGFERYAGLDTGMEKEMGIAVLHGESQHGQAHGK